VLKHKEAFLAEPWAEIAFSSALRVIGYLFILMKLTGENCHYGVRFSPCQENGSPSPFFRLVPVGHGSPFIRNPVPLAAEAPLSERRAASDFVVEGEVL
jgi:hypothetical protein